MASSTNQPANLCIGATQRTSPVNYSHLDIRPKPDRKGSGEELKSLLHLRKKLMEDAKSNGNNREYLRLTGLGVWDSVLPRDESLEWQEDAKGGKGKDKVKESWWTKRTKSKKGKKARKGEPMVDTMKPLPETPVEALPKIGVEAFLLGDLANMHHGQRVTVNGKDYQLELHPLMRGSSQEKTCSLDEEGIVTVTMEDEPEIEQVPATITYRAYVPSTKTLSAVAEISGEIDIENAERHFDSSPTTTSSSDSTPFDQRPFRSRISAFTDPSIVTSDTVVNSIEEEHNSNAAPDQSLDIIAAPALPVKSHRRPSNLNVSHQQDVVEELASPSTTDLVPAPLFSNPKAPAPLVLPPPPPPSLPPSLSEMQEILPKEMMAELTKMQLKSDMQALEDHRVGMFEPADVELEIIWARVREGVDRGLIVI